MSIVLVTGGARSGKSSFAEEYIKERYEKVAYIATAIAFDEGMVDRIKKHQDSRPKEWTTYEQYKNLHTLISEMDESNEVALLDCVTIMVTNLMFEKDVDWDKVSREEIDSIEETVKNEFLLLLRRAKEMNFNLVLVTNELGMGIVPESRLSRIFRDMAGRVNQLISKRADEVYFLVSGIPMKIK
ncbi:MAG: bifunctional adenosylcobinamide kinase/adenosylcobinamide-phosphate guanylyltransferase [Anaeromicrobium sp.]|jgi:adenosylcobinamide kinase/adenosylcobinamide-phosphate guanylyltransferase|uniref:bifunctional adenosylcobinamide kinase/adenosylcobinamide-phosphate guanylyltransferase n=1 Tax=Anaeromicrobium sp. TaxID=1929132 RepID=UPI0025F462FC|nr:bifunctional adenosylcobinamide kinase/adenosylcobinamide-phosphate guanylyltransferase [Anaeromicrobium sp.]MCT4593016.1 bifunctional adenosylcobinamide kinase/adenosylcobinamide-phosphate guanylyltransferase [Anaeromicrobium sp.]